MANKAFEQRLRRKLRVRARVTGTSERPRLTVFRSNKHIYAQVIDDSSSQSLVSVSTLSKQLKDKLAGQDKSGEAKLVGTAIAEACKGAGITKVVFDRNGYAYHGRISALAEAAREAGLEF
ncbi:MAG: 50S ribosomal protein L18 [Deltaproteobacteria bacterium]|jgi:large subunit ribosomal protein L18|nr:50S ribosomal protein L18 [Deltaproteobacteria bacterium]MBK8241463.1 50S ribosomal protein L18 [Deltaproteobacteria bacterium]MBK8717175.1 50S ribosomal protein L18 [Deltaproteobacteria bacterium]MBP7286301.1 50S ribosomal protein L18 [Nannocystaceae bacterium]